MSRVAQLTNLYVATLRSIYLIEQQAHWQTKGLGFYGDHLLFERIYKVAAEDADAAAERFIGLFGADSVDAKAQAEYIGKVLAKYSNKEEQLEIALAIEKDFISFGDQFYSELDKAEVLTLGLEDLLPHISGNRETAVYLLQQALDKSASE
jgi:DNA-binding ferritin-like protein